MYYTKLVDRLVYWTGEMFPICNQDTFYFDYLDCRTPQGWSTAG